jgi:DNA/RNA endonuclease G (NUC1)
MRKLNALRWLLTAGALILSSIATAQVRISEFHYDNTGTDSGEAIEVSAPAGTDLTGWSIVLYNGLNGASYDTDALSTPVPATCGTRGVVVLNYPSNGIQNGAPDGLALVDGSGAVIEFLSYEGVFAATNGPANGLTSVDIGASQNGSEPVGASLARNAAGVWSPQTTNSFGACNDDGSEPPAPVVASVTVAPANAAINVGSSVNFSASAIDAGGLPVPGVVYAWTSSNPAIATVNAGGAATGVAEGDVTITATAANGVAGSAALRVNPATPPPPLPDVRVSEIHYDNTGVDAGEAIEIEGPEGATLTGFSLVLYDGTGGLSYNSTVLDGALSSCGNSRGVVVVNYPSNGIQNGSPDGIALVDPAGQVVQFISYEGTFTPTNGPAAGIPSIDIGAEEASSSPIGASLQLGSGGVWALATSSFGACNGDGGPPPPTSTISFSGRVPSDPPLPVGYEDQIFGTLRVNNVVTPTTFTWQSETPAIATIDANGVFRALTEGTAVLRATAADGTTATYSLPTRVAVASGVTYPGNAELGEPADADSTDDVIVRHEQFTASYNPNRGGPNWVSYDLDAAHFGAEDRCDCFTMDPDLPASFPQISTNDYTGAGAFAGFGIDRGHMTRSFDRTTGSLDNARTYLFSNVVPQTADMNQGPWAIFENYLGDLARVDNREVYVVTGVAGNAGTLKNEGRVVIPVSTWKVAVIVPRDTGLANIRDYRDLQVIAVNMPNIPGIRNVPWQDYQTTVDAIEALSGYDLLALLPDDAENAIESNTQPPIAAITGPAGAIAEGDAATFDASGSLDPNGTVANYAWDFGDGSVGSGSSVTHTFVQDGTFQVRLTTTDNDGLVDTAIFTLTVTNVAPELGAIPAGNVDVGAVYTVAGTFADPGADAWTATVDWGDGSAPSVVALSARSFSLTHTYATADLYTVTVTIADDDASTLASHSVTVAQPAPTLSQALALVDQLIASGKLKRALGIVIKAEIVAAQRLLERGNTQGAIVVLRATVVSIDVLVRLRQVNAADIAPLRALLVQTINGL